MAVNNKELIWSRLHFAVRLLGLTGALAALVAAVLSDQKTFPDLTRHFAPDKLSAGQAAPSDVILFYAGAGLAALAVLVELVALTRVTAGRRNALGLMAFFQVAVAVVLVIGVNVWSFQNPKRWDLTRDKAFTLPADLREELARLKPGGETTVVVYQCHKSNASADKPDLYDAAAERKVVEKVSDLVALLRDFGSRLRVEVLDVQDKALQDRLARVTADNPGLREAIDRAPENSIFVAGSGRVQQMSFNEFYQLDRKQSRDANQGRGNLVLLGQGEGRGVHPFVRRILNLQQRRPRVGVLVIHELLTTEGSDDLFTLAGLRKVLTVNGFDVKDVVLKKGWDRGGRIEPAADTAEESKLERLEAELEAVNEDIKDLDEVLQDRRKALDDLRVVKGEDTDVRLKELSAKYGRLVLGGKVTERLRELLTRRFEEDVPLLLDELAAKRKERDKLEADRSATDVDAVTESRRLADVKAKLTFTLADCDLVILPRLTRQSASGQLIIPRLYKLSEEQVTALGHFVKAGKPLLACMGPVSEPPGVGMRLPPELGPPGPDGLENMLQQVGFHLAKHTVLFNADARAFVERRQDLLRQETPVEVPPLDWEAPIPPNDPRLTEKATAGPEHELRDALKVLAHSGGKGLELRFRFPRPVAFTGDPDRGGTFLVTASGWNESRPFPSADWRPRYTPAKPDDPDNETLDARRRGAFSVGAAAEVSLPDGKPARLAVIGSGEAFNGRTLDPGRERLLLVTANWLLGADDYLPTAEHPWRYPRLGLTPSDHAYDLWLWGTRVGLPVLFAFLGAVVLLFRRLR